MPDNKNGISRKTETGFRHDLFPVTRIISAVVFLVAIIGVFQLFSLSALDITKPSSTKISEADNAYFRPPPVNEEAALNGKIVLLNPPLGNLTHELLDENNTRQAYLISKNHDLNLSRGLSVEVTGVYEKRFVDGFRILQVDSIKIK